MSAQDQKVIAVKSRMQELAAKFVARSAGELDTLRGSLERLSAGDSGAVAEIRHLAHRMCGTGATLGFATLADCAMRVEKLADAQDPGFVPDAATLTQFGIALDALGVEIDRLRMDSPLQKS